MKEMLQRQIGGKPEIGTAKKRADALWACAEEASNGTLSGQELKELCCALTDTQLRDAASKSDGLWPVMVVDQMPSEAWVDFVFMPSYAACAILLCGYHRGFVKRIPELESALCKGLRAAFPDGVISAHGNGWSETTRKVRELMDRCGLQSVKELFGLELRDPVID